MLVVSKVNGYESNICMKQRGMKIESYKYKLVC